MIYKLINFQVDLEAEEVDLEEEAEVVANFFRDDEKTFKLKV